MLSSIGAAYVREALAMVLYKLNRTRCDVCEFLRDRKASVLMTGRVREIILCIWCTRFSLSVIVIPRYFIECV